MPYFMHIRYFPFEKYSWEQRIAFVQPKKRHTLAQTRLPVHAHTFKIDTQTRNNQHDVIQCSNRYNFCPKSNRRMQNYSTHFFACFFIWYGDSVPPMLSIPNQLEAAYQGQDVTLECQTEAYPASINYWTTEKGDMIISGKFFTLNFAILNENWL